MDLISGLFMIQIIFLHIFQFANLTENKTFSFVMQVLFFFMPWFYFKSGYFYTRTETPFTDYVFNKSRKLLIPFLSFAFIGFIIALPFNIYFDDRPVWRIIASFPYSILRNGNGGIGNLPLWFLLSLFFTVVGYYIIDKLSMKWVIVLFPLIGYIIVNYNIQLPLGLSNLFLGIMFYSFGNIYRNIENTKFSGHIIWISIIIYLITQLFCFSTLDFRSLELLEGNYFVYLISSIAGIIVICYLAKKINYIYLINYIGKHSLIYFIVHWPIIILIKNIFKILSINTNEYIYVSILAFLIFVPMPFIIKWLNSSKLKFILGN